MVSILRKIKSIRLGEKKLKSNLKMASILGCDCYITEEVHEERPVRSTAFFAASDVRTKTMAQTANPAGVLHTN
jgi:hypothetical protein